MVLLVQNFKHNLLSVGKLLVDSGFEVVFQQQECVIRSCLVDCVVAVGHKINDFCLMLLLLLQTQFPIPNP